MSMDRKDPSPSTESKALVTFKEMTHPLLAISPNGKKLAYCEKSVSNGTIIIINLANNTSKEITPAIKPPETKNSIQEMAWVNDDNLVYILSDGTLRKWDFGTWWPTKEDPFGTDAYGVGSQVKLTVIPGDRFLTCNGRLFGNSFEWNLTSRQHRLAEVDLSHSIISVMSNSELAVLAHHFYCYDYNKKQPTTTPFYTTEENVRSLKPFKMTPVSPDRVVIQYAHDTSSSYYKPQEENKNVIRLWDIRTGKIVSEINIEPPESFGNKFEIKEAQILRLPDCSSFVVAYQADKEDKSLHGICLQQVATATGQNQSCTFLPLESYRFLDNILVNPSNSHFIISDGYGIKDQTAPMFTYEKGFNEIHPFIQAVGPVGMVLNYLGLFRHKPAENKEGSSAESKQKPTSDNPKSAGK